MASAPGRSGARLPEKRVTARSKLPQKKCTGLHFPTKPARNSWKTFSHTTRILQKRCAYSGSYEACFLSLSKRTGFGTSQGKVQIFTAMPSDCKADMNSA